MNEPNHISEKLDKIRSNIDRKYRSSMSLNKINLSHILTDDLSEHCHIQTISANRLVIATDSSVSLFRLNMQRDSILIQLKRDFPDIQIDDLKLIISTEE